MTGYDPVKLTEYSVIFSVVALPLTYLPILLVANDRRTWASTNGRLANTLGVLYLVVIRPIAVAAIPLLIVTNGGPGMTGARRRPRRSASSTTSSSTCDGDNCGKVDELEIGGLEGDAPVEAHLRRGGAWRGRGRLGRAVARLGGTARARRVGRRGSVDSRSCGSTPRRPSSALGAVTPAGHGSSLDTGVLMLLSELSGEVVTESGTRWAGPRRPGGGVRRPATRDRVVAGGWASSSVWGCATRTRSGPTARSSTPTRSSAGSGS